MANLDIIKKLLSEKKWKISELSEELSISRQIVHRYIKKLLEKGEVKKIGTAPLVYYQTMSNRVSDYKLETNVKNVIDKSFPQN